MKPPAEASYEKQVKGEVPLSSQSNLHGASTCVRPWLSCICSKPLQGKNDECPHQRWGHRGTQLGSGGAGIPAPFVYCTCPAVDTGVILTPWPHPAGHQRLPRSPGGVVWKLSLRFFPPMELNGSTIDSSHISLLEPERNWAKLFFLTHLWLVEILE